MHVRLNPHYSLCMSGSGLLWFWGFLHFFWSQSMLAGIGGSALGDLPYLGSTLLASFVVAAVASGAANRSLHMHLAYLGCLLLILGMLLDLASQTIGSGVSELHLLSNIALGGGMGIFWIAWGCLYIRSETESVEYAFMGWLALLAVLLTIAAGISLLGDSAVILSTGLLLLLPCASLACFWASEHRIEKHTEESILLDEHYQEGQDGQSLRRGVVWPLLNLVCVFAATSLAWNAFLYRINLDADKQIALFALGVTALFFIIWLALRLTRHFSLSTLYRWALPLMAVGCVLYQFSNTVFIVPVFLCLSIVNTGFEVMGKLLYIYIAKRKPRYAVSIVAIGFAAAAMGGIIGTSLWGSVLETFGAGAAGNTLLVALLVFVVGASIALGKDDDTQSSMRYPMRRAVDAVDSNTHLDRSASGNGMAKDYGSSDNNHIAKCLAIAERYGLSERELDVLILLSQGRSRAHIRETLYISKGTVDSHIHHIYSKIGIVSRDELIRLFLD